MEAAGERSNDESDSGSSLDHALLESLFYNEMLLTDDESLLAGPPLESAVAVADFCVAASVNGGPHAAAAAPVIPEPWVEPLGVSSAASQPLPAAGVSEVSQERAKKLVLQFATLAERLGISLPPNVLHSLTVAAAENEAQSVDTAAPVQPVALAAPLSASLPVVVPKVQQLESTAEAAIAAVTRKRKEEDETTTTAKPLYSKRRKKPRLSDCEDKLVSLQAENEMLKRHLAAVANKAHIFDRERERATQEMKRMMDERAAPEKLNPVLHKFGEMYSDYGRHRHQELTFHLGQLEK
jgi:hypothetical protein